MTSAGFEASVSASESPQTHTFTRAATVIALQVLLSKGNIQEKGLPDRTVYDVRIYTDSARPNNKTQVLRPVDG